MKHEANNGPQTAFTDIPFQLYLLVIACKVALECGKWNGCPEQVTFQI